MLNEYLDLVNDKDQVIGRKLRSEIYQEKLSNFRTICVFIRNSENKLWIPRRTVFKAIFPSCLDMSAAGHVESGETYEESFKRELIEELNIDANAITWKLLGYLTPQNHGTSSFVKVFEIESNIVPEFNKEDYTEFYWLTPEELIERIKSDDSAKSDLSIIVKYFYL